MNALTAGEKAYLDSGGQDASALLAENAGTTQPADTVAPVEPVAPLAAEAPLPGVAPQDPQTPDHPELGEEEIAAPDGKTKRRVVDSRALKAEREQRRAAETALREERELRARIDERLKMLSEAVSQPEPQAQIEPEAPEAPIDPEQDIFGAYKQQQRQLAKLMDTITSLQAGQSEMRQQTQEERQTSSLISNYKRDAASFKAQKADFDDGYNFLLTKRGEQLKAMGYADSDIATMLYNEEMSLAQRALSMGQSPAAQIYGLAQSMGYQPRQAAPAGGAPAAAGGRPAAAPATPVPSVTAEIDRIKAGQASSRSLSSGGGAAGEELSLEALADMPQKQFEAFMNVPGNRERVEKALGSRAA